MAKRSKVKGSPEYKAREELILTIGKIEAIESPLGKRWKEGMLVYYYGLLAELVLHQSGKDDQPTDVITALAHKLRQGGF